MGILGSVAPLEGTLVSLHSAGVPFLLTWAAEGWRPQQKRILEFPKIGMEDFVSPQLQWEQAC